MIPPILCKRSLEILHRLEQSKLESVTADEIEQLIKLGLVVEADPHDLAIATRMAELRTEFAEHFHDDLFDAAAFKSALADIEEKLKSEWYRLRTSNARLRVHEASRVELRRALGALHDQAATARLRKLATDGPLVLAGARYIVCQSLGVECYAITRRGAQVAREIAGRLARVGEAPLGAFLKSFDKTQAKMAVFAQEVNLLTNNIGYVRKNPEQVVIGLAKSGLPAWNALGVYRDAHARTGAADVAVVCTRNVKSSGSASSAHRRLNAAIAALLAAGYHRTPHVLGAAKTLLAYEPPSAGVPRFVDLHKQLITSFGGNSDQLFKFIVRLMPASGTPAELSNRISIARKALRRAPSQFSRSHDDGSMAVAIAAMVRHDYAIEDAVKRLRSIEGLLVQHTISNSLVAEHHALECLGCPGTPTEVVMTVQALCLKIQPSGIPTKETAAIAVSFAKRFAY